MLIFLGLIKVSFDQNNGLGRIFGQGLGCLTVKVGYLAAVESGFDT